jgi:hypothetical protein
MAHVHKGKYFAFFLLALELPSFTCALFSRLYFVVTRFALAILAAVLMFE